MKDKGGQNPCPMKKNIWPGGQSGVSSEFIKKMENFDTNTEVHHQQMMIWMKFTILPQRRSPRRFEGQKDQISSKGQVEDIAND